MRVETTENGEIQIPSCLDQADCGTDPTNAWSPDRRMRRRAREHSYVDRVFDTFQDVPAAFESYRCRQL